MILASLLDVFDVEATLKWAGPSAVVLVAAVVFAESGLFFGFFLPGDSLLFMAGFFSKQEEFHINIWVLLVAVFVAAVSGDQVGYLFGRRVGPALFKREESRFFKPAHLEKAEGFYEKHGRKTIILARFVPIIRTFAPIVAGAGKMKYRTFVSFNVVGGFLWGVGVTSLGYFLGSFLDKLVGKENVEKYLLVIIFAIVALSLVPVALEVVKHRREAKLRVAEGSTAATGDEAGAA